MLAGGTAVAGGLCDDFRVGQQCDLKFLEHGFGKAYQGVLVGAGAGFACKLQSGEPRDAARARRRVKEIALSRSIHTVRADNRRQPTLQEVRILLNSAQSA